MTFARVCLRPAHHNSLVDLIRFFQIANESCPYGYLLSEIDQTGGESPLTIAFPFAWPVSWACDVPLKCGARFYWEKIFDYKFVS